MSVGGWLVNATAWLMLGALPASNNFQLNSYGFGGGGTADSSSSSYRVNGTAGEVTGSAGSSNYKVAAGEKHVKEANVPTVALSNTSSWYNKLKLVVGPENNPSDATFAIAISSDGFTTTQYVKSDFTIGASLTTADYLTYTAWGGSTGVMVRGLTRSTVYSVMAKAYRGAFTESAYGPVSTASTVDPQLAFDIDVDAADISTSPPYEVDFGSLLPGVVTNAPKRVWVSLSTNAESGAKVFVSGQYSGLQSITASYTIASITGDISSSAEGFGVQGASATQTADGPLTLVAPYNGAGQNVGLVDALIRNMFSTAGPVTGGRGSFVLKAKSKTVTPASTDYADILTAIAAGSF